MKMRMASILHDAGAAKDLLAVQHGLRRETGTGRCVESPTPLKLHGKFICAFSLLPGCAIQD